MSEVWNHFYMAPNGLSVNCNHCGKFMKRSDSSTKSMWGHLKAFHSDLVGEETFRLKRTRRMRGDANNENNKKTKISRQKKQKIEISENKTERQNQSLSSENSNISENSSSGEEGEEENFSGSNSSLTAEKRQMIKEEIEEVAHLKDENSSLEEVKQPMGSALSIQTLLKLDSKGENEKNVQGCEMNSDQKFELSQQLVHLQHLQNQQNLFNNQNILFGLPTSINSSMASSLSSSTSPPNFPIQNPSNIQKSPSNTPSLPKYSTAALLQNQQQKEGKTSPAHGTEAPLASINNLNSMTQQNLLNFGINDPQLVARLETAAALNQMAQLQQLEKTAMLQHLQQKNTQTTEQQQVLQQQALNEMFALFAASEAFQQNQPFLPNIPQNTPQHFSSQQAFASWLCNLEWMAALQRAQQGQQHLNKQSFNKNVLNTNETQKTSKTNLPQQNQNNSFPSQTSPQQHLREETFSAALQNLLSAQTQSEQHLNNQTNSDFNKQTVKTRQKRKSGLTSATLLTSPTPSTSEASSTPLHVLAETATSINNKMFPNISTNESQPPRNFPSNQQLINEHLAESLAESLVLYGMHRIAMDLQLSYSVQANKQGKAEYAFYKNSGGISTIQSMVTLTESTDQQMLNIREYANGTIVSEEYWPKNAEPCSLLNSLRDKCQKRLFTL
ncbi:hypothetical protein ACQ4LE_005877 [Meloidogyne hapla]|uniref:BED-type domain-containing protein n=1 Tax=Meloidogyne hapla TaxID=6305 RepID=A0A1I8B5S7_MELHA